MANKSPRGWSLQPRFHDDVASLLEEEDLHFRFHSVDDDQGKTRERDTHIMGRFQCRNRRCRSTGWSSKKIPITIRMYSGDLYNARVYHQRCMHCEHIGRPILDESYAERVTYWLKKWNGVAVERPVSSGVSRGPHNSALCEGCRVGHCNEADNDLIAQLTWLSI